MINEHKNTVVIVESPAKAATIGKYLGDQYKVIASYGHVRDLLNKSGSVDTNNDFAMTWAPTEKSQKHIEEILKFVKGCDEVLLATDPDREGEAIAWHILELINQRYGANYVTPRRVVFHEITKKAILEAVQKPKELDDLLIAAYLARRALDYLVGYSLSPILWQKLPGSRSAGRVQSVALRLIVEKEQEIEKFITDEYWTIDGFFQINKKEILKSRLVQFNGQKLSKLSIKNKEQASEICNTVSALEYIISSIEKKKIKRNPYPPFTTSTLQQEASRKLGFSASRTMRTAQKLYEGIKISGEHVGLITYMRTDSLNLSKDFLEESRNFIKKEYGSNYLPESARIYKTKAKNAQEAHEAIRPTSVLRNPYQIKDNLDSDQFVLYELIWKRSVASQMENAIFDQVSVDISDIDQKHVFHAVGTTQVFDGFLKIYQEGTDDEEEVPGFIKLPDIKESDNVVFKETKDEQHFTIPPPRFTEASLVKKLEALGIGRPSTYAPLMQVLQDRDYVTLEKKQFIPSDRGRVVTFFLTNFCSKYVEYDFTASMEEELDNISEGKVTWKKVLEDFWVDFSQTISQMKNIRVTEVIDKLNEELAPLVFKNSDEKRCDKCENGEMGIKLSTFGAFLGCSNYPECSSRRPMVIKDSESKAASLFDTIDLGIDSSDNSKVSLRKGPYGFYVQFDLPEEISETKSENVSATTAKSARKKKILKNVKRIGISSNTPIDEVTLDYALKLKALPKNIGVFEKNDIIINIGRFGPYIKCGDIVASIPKTLNFLDLSTDEAIALIQKKREKGSKIISGATSKTKVSRKANSSKKKSQK